MRDIEWVDFKVSKPSPDTQPVTIEGHFVPQKFAIDFLLKDQKPSSLKLWGLRMVLEFNSDVVPRAIEVSARGFTHTLKKGVIAPLVSGEPVERWQLQGVERNIQDLTALAVSLSIQDVTYEEDGATVRRKIKDRIENEATDLTSSEPEPFNWDNLEFFNPWETNNNSSKALFDSGVEWEIDAKTLEEIRSNVSRRIRRRPMSDSHYKEVARIYLEEKKRAQNISQRAEPVKVLMEKFHTHERTVGFWIKEARDRGLIPPLPKKVSTASKEVEKSVNKKPRKGGIK